MEAGDFYGSTGVVLREDVKRDTDGVLQCPNSCRARDVTYLTEFIGTYVAQHDTTSTHCFCRWGAT